MVPLSFINFGHRLRREHIFVLKLFPKKNVYIVCISVFNSGSNLQQSVKYFASHCTTKKKKLTWFFLSCNGNLCTIYYYNAMYISLRFITIEFSISHSVLCGFAGWTVHVDFGRFLWRILHSFLVGNSWSCRIGMGLRYVNLQRVKHTELQI